MASANNNSSSTAATAPTIPESLQHLTPLTKNELLLLSTYDQIKQYEKISAKLKATEAKRRLEEADERYRAKVRERERLENGGGGADDNDDSIEEEEGKGDTTATRQYNGSSDNNNSEEEEDDDEATTLVKQKRLLQKQQKRRQEITQLREEIEAKSQQTAERDAARQREEEMRRELLGPEEDMKKRKKKKKKRPREEGVGDDNNTMEESEQMKNDVTNNDAEEEEEEDTTDNIMNNQSSSIISGPSLKKKRINTNDDDTQPSTSLIANISGGATPIHDFSSKLKMSKTSLDGTILFPTTIGEKPWRPPSNPVNFMDGCLELDLPNFDPNNNHLQTQPSNNTLAIKFHAPQESSRFSINIATPNHNGYDSILFHFNPRQFQRGGQLVINNKKESMWGNDLSVPLSTLPLVFGKTACTLIVQINDEGFDVFVEGVHCARLEHRMDLPKVKGGPLCLQFPASDDYGNPEDWEVYRIWWGYKSSMTAGKDLSGVAGVNIYSSVHPKKLFVSGLPKIHSDPEMDLRRAELERAFRKYGGPNGAVFVSVQKDSTFAFVEVASEQQADLALVEMAGRYRVNKARRTKHEALMEERAAKEAAEKGNVMESVDWD